jgi:type I restriction enzyme M protein
LSVSSLILKAILLRSLLKHLLSILSNQGDLGSFRTPRHIIDFIVSVINPKKNEKILDPACGTAGFLISALNHIIKNNSSNNNPEKKIDHTRQNNTYTDKNIKKKEAYLGDKLTTNERETLTESIVGYDIDSNMVKLALVNLYLHGVSKPQIYEYDTLTSDIKWNENYDVILANPPFMTPNGGVTPHSRFRINSNRTEVLFIEYIAQHLNIEHGRAGIIVPEGVVFNSNNSYKNLRKNLIENWGLYAVVSLPSGTFQPYSTVKTCILLLDYKFSKMVDEILFVKVENDGFELGSQRKKHDKNDLPNCLNILSDWKNQKNDVKSSRLAFSVKKIKDY